MWIVSGKFLNLNESKSSCSHSCDGSCESSIQVGGPTSPLGLLQGDGVVGALRQAAQEHGDQLGHVLGRAAAQREVSSQRQQRHGLDGALSLPGRRRSYQRRRTSH